MSQNTNKSEWYPGQPIKVYSQSLNRWCPGEIVAITRDDEGECLDLRYWDGSTPKAKYLDFHSSHILPVPNPQNVTRKTWGKGSHVECWSNSRKRWFKAEIIEISQDNHYNNDNNSNKNKNSLGKKNGDEEEWLKLQWETTDSNGDASTMTKEVTRTSLWIRPRYFKEDFNNVDIHDGEVCNGYSVKSKKSNSSSHKNHNKQENVSSNFDTGRMTNSPKDKGEKERGGSKMVLSNKWDNDIQDNISKNDRIEKIKDNNENGEQNDSNIDLIEEKEKWDTEKQELLDQLEDLRDQVQQLEGQLEDERETTEPILNEVEMQKLKIGKLEKELLIAQEALKKNSNNDTSTIVNALTTGIDSTIENKKEENEDKTLSSTNTDTLLLNKFRNDNNKLKETITRIKKEKSEKEKLCSEIQSEKEQYEKKIQTLIDKINELNKIIIEEKEKRNSELLQQQQEMILKKNNTQMNEEDIDSQTEMQKQVESFRNKVHDLLAEKDLLERENKELQSQRKGLEIEKEDLKNEMYKEMQKQYGAYKSQIHNKSYRVLSVINSVSTILKKSPQFEQSCQLDNNLIQVSDQLLRAQSLLEEIQQITNTTFQQHSRIKSKSISPSQDDKKQEDSQYIKHKGLRSPDNSESGNSNYKKNRSNQHHYPRDQSEVQEDLYINSTRGTMGNSGLGRKSLSQRKNSFEHMQLERSSSQKTILENKTNYYEDSHSAQSPEGQSREDSEKMIGTARKGSESLDMDEPSPITPHMKESVGNNIAETTVKIKWLRRNSGLFAKRGYENTCVQIRNDSLVLKSATEKSPSETYPWRTVLDIQLIKTQIIISLKDNDQQIKIKCQSQDQAENFYQALKNAQNLSTT